MEPVNQNIGLSLLFATLLVVWCCNASPTVPVPPPEAITVHPPDSEGFALVEAAPNSALPGDVVLIFNKSIGTGVMTVAESNGSFRAAIEAEPGNQLSVQIVREDAVSESEVSKTVPAD